MAIVQGSSHPERTSEAASFTGRFQINVTDTFNHMWSHIRSIWHAVFPLSRCHVTWYVWFFFPLIVTQTFCLSCLSPIFSIPTSRHTVRFPGQQEESPNASVYIIKLDHQSLMIWEQRTKMTNMLHNHYFELIRIFSENRDKQSSMNIV